MGNETLYATKGYLSIIRWVDPSINIDAYIEQRVLSVGGNTAVAGDVMTVAGETQGYVDICAESDTGFLGINAGLTVPPDNYDLDDAQTDGETVNILRPTGGRTIVALICDSSGGPVAWEEGDYARVGSTAGHVESWIYNDTNMSTDTFALVVGKLAQVYAGHTSDDKVIHVWY
jgi:hypothetical protein